MKFNAGTIVDQVQAIANNLPNDKLFFAKNIEGSNLRKLLYGLAYEVWRMENRVTDIAEQYDITKTIDLLTRWESALGIPDSCFDISVYISRTST
jgi:uncharacterized protein YmfQ (DUF2313 family)